MSAEEDVPVLPGEPTKEPCPECGEGVVWWNGSNLPWAILYTCSKRCGWSG